MSSQMGGMVEFAASFIDGYMVLILAEAGDFALSYRLTSLASSISISPSAMKPVAGLALPRGQVQMFNQFRTHGDLYK